MGDGRATQYEYSTRADHPKGGEKPILPQNYPNGGKGRREGGIGTSGAFGESGHVYPGTHLESQACSSDPSGIHRSQFRRRIPLKRKRKVSFLLNAWVELEDYFATCVGLPEVVYPQVVSVVEAEPGVLPDDDLARRDDAVRLLPDHSGLACGEEGKSESGAKACSLCLPPNTAVTLLFARRIGSPALVSLPA